MLLVQGTEPTLEKRWSQVNLLFQSLRPKGYTRETFAGQKALALTPERVAELVDDGKLRCDERVSDAILFHSGEWKSPVTSRNNDDGTTSFITMEPTRSGFEFVKGERGGKRVLAIRDSQHAYDFTEGAGE